MKTALIGFVFSLLGGWIGVGPVAAPRAGVPQTIVDFQPFRQAQSITIPSAQGRDGTATLVNLNPTIGVWYVLTITWNNGQPQRAYHLENPGRSHSSSGSTSGPPRC